MSSSSSPSPSSSNDGAPSVTRDPRFRAARRLVQNGRAGEGGAIEMFATLVEECISRHGDTSIESAACFYEYGNALFRAASAATTGEAEEESGADPLAKPENAKAAAAQAAEERARKIKQQQQEEDGAEADSKPAVKENGEAKSERSKTESSEKIEKESKVPKDDDDNEKEEEQADDDDNDDILLALEMMENCWGIFEETTAVASKESAETPVWLKNQLPRVLQGIGDVLRELGRKPDAADAYSRALPYREAIVNEYPKESLEVSYLKAKRLLTEANVLVAEALLECEDGQDVVTTETNDVLVKANERVDYARGYYDKARDALQETVFLMGKIAATGKDLGVEKEDVCFCATLLMGVGETIAAYDEKTEEAESGGKPPAKKLKLK